MDFNELKDKLQDEVEGVKGSFNSLLDRAKSITNKTIGKKKDKASEDDEDFDDEEEELELEEGAESEDELALDEGQEDDEFYQGVGENEDYIDPDSKKNNTSLFDRQALKESADGEDNTLDDYEEWDEDEKSESAVSKIRSKIRSKFDDGEGKIDRSKVMKTIIIAGIVLLFVAEFIPTADDQQPNSGSKKSAAEMVKARKKRSAQIKRKRMAAKKKKQQQAKKSAAAEKKRLAEQQARENARKKKLADQQAIVDARKKKLADQQAIEDARKKKIADEQAAIEAKKKLGEKKTDQPIVGGAGGVSQDISAKIGKIVSQIDDTAQIKVDLQKKIYSQTAPPAYTKTGRGLVYNCVGQHWACVNKNTYIKCRGNMMWNKQGRKLPECITRNVYRNKQDCFTVQTHNINTIKNTSFCK